MGHGDIYWIDLPRPEAGQEGREQFGRRPAVMIEPVPQLRLLPTMLVAPFTSQLQAQRLPFTLRIEPTVENRLSQPSILLLFQLRAIDRNRVREQLGRLDAADLQRLTATLQAMLLPPPA